MNKTAVVILNWNGLGYLKMFLSKVIQLSGYVAYGTKDKDWKTEIMMKTILPSQNDRWRVLTAYYRYDLTVLGQENQLLTFDNIFTLLRGKLLSRMMKIREVHIDLENMWVRGFSSIIALENKTYFQIPGIFDFNAKRENGSYSPIPKFNTTEIYIDSRIAPKDKYYKA